MNSKIVSLITYYGIGMWTSVGFLGIIITMMVYRKLNTSSEAMGITNHPFLVQLKSKYEHCCKHRLTVNNCRNFIERQLNKHTIVGVRLRTIEKIPEKMVMMITLTGVLSVTWLYLLGEEELYLSSIVFVTITGAAGLLAIQSMADIKNKREMLFANVTDYLENYLKNRLEQEYGNATINPEWSEAIVLNTILGSDYSEEIEYQVEQLTQSMKQIASSCEEHENIQTVQISEIKKEQMIREVLEQFLS